MLSLVLCCSLFGQVVPPGKFTPLTDAKERKEYVRQKRIMEGMQAAYERKERIRRDWESGACLYRNFGVYQNPYVAQQQMWMQQWRDRQWMLYQQQQLYGY